MKASFYKYLLSYDDRYFTSIAEKINDIYDCVNTILDNRNSFIFLKT